MPTEPYFDPELHYGYVLECNVRMKLAKAVASGAGLTHPAVGAVICDLGDRVDLGKGQWAPRIMGRGDNLERHFVDQAIDAARWAPSPVGPYVIYIYGTYWIDAEHCEKLKDFGVTEIRLLAGADETTRWF